MRPDALALRLVLDLASVLAHSHDVSRHVPHRLDIETASIRIAVHSVVRSSEIPLYLDVVIIVRLDIDYLIPKHLRLVAKRINRWIDFRLSRMKV